MKNIQDKSDTTEINIINMACGHCRMKIEAELIQEGIEIVEFDMNRNIVEVKLGSVPLRKAQSCIERVGYSINYKYKEENNFDRFYIIELESVTEHERLKSLLNDLNYSTYTIDEENCILDIDLKNRDPFDFMAKLEEFGYTAIEQFSNYINEE